MGTFLAGHALLALETELCEAGRFPRQLSCFPHDEQAAHAFVGVGA